MEEREVVQEAETLEDAKKLAIALLKVPSEIIEIEILQEPSRGILGFGKKNARIKASINFDAEKEIVKFLEALFKVMEISLTVKILKNDAKGIKVNILGEDAKVIIGRQGVTLDALERLCFLTANKYPSFPRVGVQLDAEGYRNKRLDGLIIVAKEHAKEVIKTGKPKVLKSMNKKERRILHSALSKLGVSTKSHGEEPNRYITIYRK